MAYCREGFVIKGAAQGTLSNRQFILSTYSNITFEGNTTARSGASGSKTGSQYDMAWTLADCWHETDTDATGTRLAPCVVLFEGAPPAGLKTSKLCDATTSPAGPPHRLTRSWKPR